MEVKNRRNEDVLVGKTMLDFDLLPFGKLKFHREYLFVATSFSDAAISTLITKDCYDSGILSGGERICRSTISFHSRTTFCENFELFDWMFFSDCVAATRAQKSAFCALKSCKAGQGKLVQI